jgi:N-acetylmuramoyl-L-alanine amidase
MRQDTGIRPAPHPFPASRRVVAAGAPLAIAGSLALVCAAVPAPAEASGLVPASREADAAHGVRSIDPRAVAIVRTAAVRATATDDYVVQPGDTVSAIAARHGLRTADVLSFNGLGWRSVIMPGQVLHLSGSAPAPSPPAPAPAASGHTVVAGDTVSAIARAHGTSVQAVLDANGLTRSSIIYPGQTLAIPGTAAAAQAPAPSAPAPAAPAPAASEYTVVAGDTVSAIARAHGTSVQAVLDANGLTRSSIIHPGQTLAIPGTATAEAMVPAAAVAGPSVSLDAEQTANARLIIAIGRQLGVPDRGIAIALGTAMQESWLRNLDWGDRDSLGLFQQRPSTGWGTADEVRDPDRATRAFFGGAGDPNGDRTRGLLDIPGWQSMTFADAAQAVQISAYPDRYAAWEQPATAWLAALG